MTQPPVQTRCEGLRRGRGRAIGLYYVMGTIRTGAGQRVEIAPVVWSVQ